MNVKGGIMSCRTSFQDTYWGLKDNWWKQVYDGRVHSYGPEVFDKGLHKGDIEPGFYESIHKAKEYASDQLGKPLTIDVYKTIHSIACSHFFNVSRRNRNVNDENINKFRATHCYCTNPLQYNTSEPEDASQKKIRRLNFCLTNEIRWTLRFTHKIDSGVLDKEELARIHPQIKASLLKQITEEDVDGDFAEINIEDVLTNGNPFLERRLESFSEVKEEQKKIQSELNLSQPLVNIIMINEGSPALRVIYTYKDPVVIEEITNKLIHDYNQKIGLLPLDPFARNQEENELALRYIAELFQRLEWLHPFFDGQGRTDLVLLSKLLTENGFNPTILYDPYFSSFQPLDKWITYLKSGIEAWKEELKKVAHKLSASGGC